MNPILLIGGVLNNERHIFLLQDNQKMSNDSYSYTIADRHKVH